MNSHEGSAPDDPLAGLDDLLASADRELDQEELRREQAHLRRVQELEEEYERLEGAVAELDPRLARAEQLQAADLVARLGGVRRALRERRQAIRSELGYDPRERRRRDFEERSAGTADELEKRIGDAAGGAPLVAAAEALVLALPELAPADAARAAGALQQRCEQLRVDAPASLQSVQALLSGIPADAPDPDERFAEAAGELAREQRRRIEARDELDAIENEVGLLETSLGRFPKPAIAARVHELACRAKLVQARNRTRLTETQHERMRRMIFGRLHAMVKDTACGFVPSLKQEWMPDSLEMEIEKARADFEEARRGRSDSPAKPPPGEEAAHARGRLGRAEQWVLAEVYRYSNARYESPSDDTAAKRLRQAARFAVEFLEDRKAELARVLRHDAELFAEGSEFRWLRRRFAKDDEAEDDGGPDEPEDSGTIESLAGERVVHPSVLRARSRTRGRQVVMVGGAVREERRERLKELFCAESWDWVPFERGDGERGIQQLASRIRNGSPDLVVTLVGFMTHSVFDHVRAAARETGVPCAVVPRGYGEAAIAEAVLSTG